MTTTIDFDALQASEGPRVTLLGNQQVGAGLVGDDFADFSSFASLSVDAKVQRMSSTSPPPALTVLVEHSDDGLSWSTAETFTFTDDGEQTASLASPKAHVRASASGSGAEWYVKSVNVAPISGGGGGLPAGLTFTRTTGNNPFLTLEAGTNGTAALAASGIAAQLELNAANGDASHVGGEVTITSGNSLGQSGGDIQVTAGSDSGGGNGGNVTVQSGRGTIGRGGDVDIRAHPSGAAGARGGRVTISGGAGGTTGGRVELDAGSPDGEVVMYSGDSNQYVQLDNDGLQIGATKLGFFLGAAVAQPGVPVTLGDVIAALQALGLVAS